MRIFLSIYVINTGSLFDCLSASLLLITIHDMFPSLYDESVMTSSNIFRVTGPLCGELTGPDEIPAQRPVTRRYDVFFDLRLNKRLSKQPWGWWFETPSWSLWRFIDFIAIRCIKCQGLVRKAITYYLEEFSTQEVSNIFLCSLYIAW